MKKNSDLLICITKANHSMGASEDLVVALAERLSTMGRAPAIWFNFAPSEDDSRVKRLIQAGCPLYFPAPSPLKEKLRRRLRLRGKSEENQRSLLKTVATTRPTRILLNQGGNSDAVHLGNLSQLTGIAYDVLCHNADPSSWPAGGFLKAMRDTFLNAERCLFVSRDNMEETEAQIASSLPNARVVYNPCKLSEARDTKWKESGEAFAIAAVARLANKQKGHDLILRVLSRPEWRKRNLKVTFFGDGQNRQSLIDYAQAQKLTNVSFPGHVRDIESIWNEHHAFIQTSRYEGYGLSLVEAMFCRRMAIATPFPSATEFIRDGETGFLARAPSPQEVHLAMERAWEQRHRWREMGLAAADCVTKGYPKDPVGDFVELIDSQ